MDLQMPVMDGFTASNTIRNELNITTPILALTANVMKGITDRCTEAGMNGYISKPFNPDHFYSQLLLLFNKTDSDSDRGEYETEIDSSGFTGGKMIDLGTITKILEGDEALITKMVRKFIEVTPAYMNDLMNAYKENDIKGLEMHAHKIKSSIDMVANTEMKDQIRMINEYCKNWEQLHHLQYLIPSFKIRYDQLISELNDELENRK